MSCEAPRTCANRFSITKCANDRMEGSPFCEFCAAMEAKQMAALKATADAIFGRMKAEEAKR